MEEKNEIIARRRHEIMAGILTPENVFGDYVFPVIKKCKSLRIPPK